MTAVERVAFALAQRFPELDAVAMAAHLAFVKALAAALTIADEASVVEQVVAMGSLFGARNAHAVVVARLRALPRLAEDRRRIVAALTESARWVAVDRAARRGENLRQLVERGDLFPDEAERMVASEFADDDLRGIATAALTGAGP